MEAMVKASKTSMMSFMRLLQVDPLSLKIGPDVMLCSIKNESKDMDGGVLGIVADS
jgi:hypothetical protein